MIQGRGGLRLALEALAGTRVLEVGLGKELQGDVAVKASVLAHARDLRRSVRSGPALRAV
jgi:hypothetical protein